jgi:hypothetical protein
MAGCASLGIIGMDLDRQLLAGEEIFDQQLRIARAGRLEPDFADRGCIGRRIGESGPQIMPAPRLFDTTGGEQGGGHDGAPHEGRRSGVR